MAYSNEQLMTALRNADAAGDTEAARRIASMIKSQQAAPQEPEGGLMDMITGESRMTPEMESMSEIGNAPELNEMSWAAFKTSLGLLATGDEEKSKAVIKQNIPEAEFTTDSKGNVIVNLPSGQYALNKAGLSGQDIAKGIFDIAAFTPAGRLASIPKVAGASAATEAGLQATTSALGGGDISGEEVIEAGLMGGAFKGAEDVIGAGYRAIRGKPQGEASEAVRFAQEQDLPLMTSDVAPPSTFVGKSAQSAAEKIPIAGTGAARAKQQEARTQLMQDFSQKFGEYNPEEVVSSLQRQTSKIKQAAGNVRQGVINQMQGVNVPAQNAIKAIDDEIARLSTTPSGEMRATADTQTIDRLMAYKTDLQADQSFDNLEQLRTQFRTDVKGERVVMPDRSQAAITKIYTAMGKDLAESVSDSLGSRAAQQWQKSNAAYANEASKIKNTRLKSVLQKGELTPEVVNNLIYSNKPSEFKTLYSSLDSRGKSAARAAIIGKALEKAGESPDRFLNQLNKMKAQLGVAFKGDDKQYLDGLMKYLDSTRQAAKAEVLTPTGQQTFQLAVPIGVGADIATGGIGTALGISYGVLAKAYESKAVRNALLRLNSLEKGSTAFEQQLEKVNSYLSAIAQSERRQD